MQSGWIVFTMVSVGLTAFAPKKAAEGDVRSQVEQLLALATEPSAKNLQAVEGYYRSLPAASREDRMLQYAYAVALIRQRHLTESAKWIARLTDEQPQLLFLWRDRVWLALALGQKTAAMTEIEQLAAHAQAHQAVRHDSISDTETAEFLGAVCGFISGPWSHRVPEADVKKAEGQLRSIFDDDSRVAFDRSKAKLTEQYQELLEAHQQRAQNELQAKTIERQAAEQAAGRTAKQLDAKQQALKDKEKKRTIDAKAKIDDLDRQLKKLDDDRQALLVKMAPLEAHRAALVSQIVPAPGYYGMVTANPALRTPALRNWNWARASMGVGGQRVIMRRLAPVVAKVTALEAEVAALNQRELELQFELQATDVKHQSDLGKLAVKKQALETDQKRVENDTRRLKAKRLGSSPRLRVEAAQLTNFRTYVPFPFEREKERLLSEAR